MHLKDGRMHLSDRPGLGFSLTEQARHWTRETVAIDR
jgi:L-alanine-DL-glutamate epimerase-like enolase superfamily enzyme